jgi:hypothetical protein
VLELQHQQMLADRDADGISSMCQQHLAVRDSCRGQCKKLDFSSPGSSRQSQAKRKTAAGDRVLTASSSCRCQLRCTLRCKARSGAAALQEQQLHRHSCTHATGPLCYVAACLRQPSFTCCTGTPTGLQHQAGYFSASAAMQSQLRHLLSSSSGRRCALQGMCMQLYGIQAAAAAAARQGEVHGSVALSWRLSCLWLLMWAPVMSECTALAFKSAAMSKTASR